MWVMVILWLVIGDGEAHDRIELVLLVVERVLSQIFELGVRHVVVDNLIAKLERHRWLQVQNIEAVLHTLSSDQSVLQIAPLVSTHRCEGLLGAKNLAAYTALPSWGCHLDHFTYPCSVSLKNFMSQWATRVLSTAVAWLS